VRWLLAFEKRIFALVGILANCGRKEILGQMMSGSLYIFGGISAFGGVGVLTL
jgi:hypothetical protein